MSNPQAQIDALPRPAARSLAARSPAWWGSFREHSALDRFRAIFTAENPSLAALRAGEGLYHRMHGQLFAPHWRNRDFTPESARHARGNPHNVVTMIRAGWTAEQINRWVRSGYDHDIPGYHNVPRGTSDHRDLVDVDQWATDGGPGARDNPVSR